MDDAPEPGDNPTSRRALIAGATGLIGGFLLGELLEDDLYASVHALVRRPLEREHPKLEQIVVDFEKLDENADAFHVDDVFCCLGTTIKKAGSEEAFRRVDHDYVVEIARLARGAGARRFLLVSSIGADAEASNFYLSVKGETEDDLEALGYPELHVFRPSVLMGSRDDNRPAERAGIVLARLTTPLLLGRLRRYRPIEARTVAGAIAEAARTGASGRHIYTFDDIVRLSEDLEDR